MAEKDIIARLIVEGQSEFISAMTASDKATQGLDTSIDSTTSSLNAYQKSITDASKTGKGMSDSINSASKSLDTLDKELTSTDEALKKVIKDLLLSGKSAKEVGTILEQSVSKSAKSASTSLLGMTSATINNTKEFRSFIQSAKEGKATIDQSAGSYQKASTEIGKLVVTTTNFKEKTLSAKTELRQLTAQINNGNLSGEPLRIAINRAAELTDRIGDNREAIKNLASDTRGLDTFVEGATAIATSFQIAQGAAVLLGEDNEDLQKTFIKLNAIMAIANGLQQVHALTLQNSSLAMKLNAIATRAYAIAVGTSTGAMKLFRLALISTGIGALAIALIAIVTNWDKLSAAIVKSVPALGKFGKAWDTLKSTTRGFFSAVLESFTFLGSSVVAFGTLLKDVFSLGPQKAYEKFIGQIGSGIKDINNAYNDGVKLSEENTAESKRQKAVNDSILATEKQILQAKASNSSEAKITSLELKKANLELSLLKKGSNEYYEKQIEINDLLGKQAKKVKEVKTEIQSQVGSLDDLQKKYQALVNIINTTAPGTKAYNDAIEKAKELGTEIEILKDQTEALLKTSQSELYDDYVNLFEQIGNESSIATGSIADLESQLSEVNKTISEGNASDSVLLDLILQAVKLESDINEAKKRIQELKDTASGKIDISDYAETQLLNIQNEERLREQQGLTYEDKLKKLNDLETIEIGQAKNKGAEIANIEKFYANERDKLLKEDQQKRRDAIAEDLKTIQDVGNQAFGVFKAFSDARKQVLDNELKQGLISEEQYQKEVAKLQRKQAIADKAQAVFNATIQGALAVLTALAKGGPILAAFVGGLAALQVAAIIATPIPKFFKGVQRIKLNGNKEGRDTIPAMVNKGETIVPTDKAKRYEKPISEMFKGNFEKMYMPRTDIKRARIGSIILSENSQTNTLSNRKIEKQLQEMNYLLEMISIHSGSTVGNGNALNSILKKKANERKFFV